MSLRKQLQGKMVGFGEEIARKKADAQANPKEKQDEDLAATSPGMTGLLQDRKWLERRVDELEGQLEEAKRTGTQTSIPLSDLHEAPGRKRKLTDEQFNELVENLRNNPLVTPITVRTRAEGGFEIISGHNRFAAYRLLARESIPAWILESDDEQADLSAFYANLLQPSLPEYEKYQGFKKRLETSGKSQAEIAQEAGVTASYVSLLMQFEGLPNEVIRQLDERPDLIGANAAKDFVTLTRNGRSEQVINAVAEIAKGNLTQSAAVRTAAQDPTPEKPKASSKKFRAGKAVVAEMRAIDKTLRISFRTLEERTVIEAEIEAVLKKFAERSNQLN